MKPTIKDPQQFHVYEWEDKLLQNKNQNVIMSFQEISDIVFKTCSDFEIPIPEIKRNHLDLPCLANIRKWSIEISSWGRNPITVYHELSHLINFKLHHSLIQLQPHGPEFVGIEIVLLYKYLGFDMNYLKQSLQKNKILFSIPTSILKHIYTPSIPDEDFW